MRRFIQHVGRTTIAAKLLLLLSGFTSLEALFAPKPDLWPRWNKSDPASKTIVDHRPWDRFLKIYVKADGVDLNRVAYRAVEETDRKILSNYIAGLSRMDVDSLNRQEQKAFWINFYNALTVDLVLQHYPVKSIRDIDLGTGLFSFGPWDKKLVNVAGEQISLNDIEHRILRPLWRDPRIHYAVNCASVGCPNLDRDAYTSQNIDTQLDKAARNYVNSTRGALFDGEDLVLSKIYAWFKDDFGDSDAALLRHLHKYAAGALKAKLAKSPKISDYQYNWNLNDEPN